MKINYLKLVAGLFVAGTMASCSKQLDKYPFDSIELSQSFKTVKDAKTWRSGFYAYLRGRQYGIYTYSQDVQGDQLNASLDFGNRNGNPHRWEGFLADDYTIRDVWAGYYSSINNANIAVNGFEQIATANEAETAELSRYKADARLARAYYYNELMIRFAKPYAPTSATTDLGVPLVLVYDVNAKPARATAKAVYDQVLADIAYAKPILATKSVKQGDTTFNKNVVLALEARVKLYTQDWAGAKAAADEVIASNTYPLITSQATFTNYWATDGTQETILQSYVSKPNELANTNGIYLGYLPATQRFTPDFIPSQWVVDMYANTDIRKAAYFAQKPVTIQGLNYDNVYLVNKYPGNPALFTAANTNYQHAPKIFRIAELYLISAEAAFRSSNEGAALTTLNQLRVARGLAALSGVSGTALLQAIKDERFRELAFEGFRLWDLKRWNEGFTRRSPQNENMLNIGSNFTSLTIAAGAPKFTWGLPTNDITINGNLVQNQGW